MKYINYIFICLCLALVSCNENDRLTYGEKPAVYLSEYSADADSLIYSFLVTGVEQDVIETKVKLLGALPQQDLQYKVVVLENSTAIADLHYKSLPDTFTFPAKASETSFPITIYSKDEELSEKTVTLELALVDTEDLDAGYPEKLKMRLLITNQLIRPTYWDNLLFLYFGDYSKVKHRKCIETMGHDFPLLEKDITIKGYSYYMLQGRKVCEYYATHEVLDENGNLITVWNPF